MAGILSFGSSSSAPNLGQQATSATTVSLEALPVHDIEADQDRSARSLKYLLKANHVNYAVVYKELHLNNYNAQNLSTAYLLGADEDHLNDIYNEHIKELEPWKPSPAEVIDEDWVDFLGDRNYQRAFVDFYEDKLALQFSYDWKQEITHVLTSGDQPLINSLISAFGHPLDHLSLAYEVNSRALAMEGLSLACIQHNSLHKYLDDPSYIKPADSPSALMDLIARLAKDPRGRSTQNPPGSESLEGILDKHENLILEYWNSWPITDATKQFEESQRAAVTLFVSSQPKQLNTFTARLLSSNHAIRVLLPYIPAAYHASLLRQWWLLAIIVCLLTGQPEPNPANIVKDADGRTWKHVVDKALNSAHLKDPHYVKAFKAIRSIKEAARTWGDADDLYLRSALTFVDGFVDWAF